jgi:hypothetical protein
MGRPGSDQPDSPGEPGSLIRRVAGQLAARGFAVDYVAGEPESLLMTGASGTRCELEVSDCGHVEWQCSPPAPGRSDPWAVSCAEPDAGAA